VMPVCQTAETRVATGTSRLWRHSQRVSRNELELWGKLSNYRNYTKCKAGH